MNTWSTSASRSLRILRPSSGCGSSCGTRLCAVQAMRTPRRFSICNCRLNAAARASYIQRTWLVCASVDQCRCNQSPACRRADSMLRIWGAETSRPSVRNPLIMLGRYGLSNQCGHTATRIGFVSLAAEVSRACGAGRVSGRAMQRTLQFDAANLPYICELRPGADISFWLPMRTVSEQRLRADRKLSEFDRRIQF